MTDAIHSEDLLEKYKLERVKSPLSIFNLSGVHDFYSNVSSKFYEFGGVVYVSGINVLFNTSVICSVLGLDVSTAFNTVTCHYDMNAYHYEAYLDSSIPLVKGLTNNGNPTLEFTKILFAMLSGLIVPFGDIVFKSILSKNDCPGRHLRAVYAAKGKGVATNASVNFSFHIPIANHIRFTYYEVEDNVINCPEEDSSEEFATTGSSPFN
ncbi:hypothetical protein DVH24_001803 [Malus domestica]|uniref:Uncharacterized protein n=1 Tax=Malus domestica TaxID=3750 RepID=A0A498I893_MALDO|nr:hypothetical protein DVH24_001803 [Malus domestica]